MRPLQLDAELLRYCTTDRQREVVQAVIDSGGARAAARALGCNYTAVVNIVTLVRGRAAGKGYAPENDLTVPVAPGMKLARHAQYYDGDGKPRGKWVIQTPDSEAQAQFHAAMVAALKAEIVPLPNIAPPRATLDDLLNVYTFTDYHFNMLAWGEEAGDDWDMTIAARVLRLCFRDMVDRSPPAGTCVIAQLGDFAHTDGFRNATPTSGHELDADSRYPKAVRAMLYALRDLIEYAAAKHQKVVVLLAEGNHDLSSSVWMREAFAMFYEGNPRVTVMTDPQPYYAYEFGQTFLGWHHGHLAKKASLPLLFATDFAPMWGRTKYRFIHTGHEHHVDVKEHAGAEVRQHPTLAAKDAYAARGGWRAMRRAIGITYHREHGEQGSVTTTPEMIVP